ncbi:unnamed protein product [Schistocephalus solidus]|uniref:Uncharacterized protein n=1 Tax=Schistocephalus solidus TaxID=70667 RepID=A0A3P7DIB7_SCHSO|nr:unnamed protein product [Schistocephalus solidus]
MATTSGCETTTASLSTCHGECPICVSATNNVPTFLQPTAMLSSVKAVAGVSSSGDVANQRGQRSQQQNSASPVSPLLPLRSLPPPAPPLTPPASSPPFFKASTPQSNLHAFSPASKTPLALTCAGGSFSTDAEVPSSKPFMPFLNVARPHQATEPESALARKSSATLSVPPSVTRFCFPPSFCCA